MTTPSKFNTGEGPVAEPMSVLIIDDNADTAAVLAALIGTWGYRTFTAHTGKEALERSLQVRPRIVLIDLGLPDIHGYQLARTMREELRDRGVVFIAITGWSHIADQLQSTRSGISHHLVKPINHQALRAILDGYQLAERRKPVQ